jgi:Protein of unknown function (DUF1194)
MMRILSLVLTLAALLLAALSLPAQAGERVDLLLALTADVSRSMDDEEFQLQRSGYVEALSNPRVIEAIRSGPNGRIAVIFIEWSSFPSQKVVTDWTTISDAATARQFANTLVTAPRPFAGKTSISGAIDFAMAQFERASYEAHEGLRRTIDVSGDGFNNSGREVSHARDDAVAQGVTINGLVVLKEPPASSVLQHARPPAVVDYYRDRVIGGPGAFVMVAEDIESFGRALTNKLIAEIAQAHQPRHARVR